MYHNVQLQNAIQKLQEKNPKVKLYNANYYNAYTVALRGAGLLGVSEVSKTVSYTYQTFFILRREYRLLGVSEVSKTVSYTYQTFFILRREYRLLGVSEVSKTVSYTYQTFFILRREYRTSRLFLAGYETEIACCGTGGKYNFNVTAMCGSSTAHDCSDPKNISVGMEFIQLKQLTK